MIVVVFVTTALCLVCSIVRAAHQIRHEVNPKSNPIVTLNSTTDHSSVTRRTKVVGSFVLERAMAGHGNIVYSVAYSPDGSRLVSGDGDGLIKVWDMENGGTLLHNLVGHDSTVSSVAFYNDRIVSGSWDKTVKVWDVVNGGGPLQTLVGHVGSVYTVVCSRDGSRIASGDRVGEIKVWKMGKDDDSGALLLTLREGHTRAVSSVAFNDDGSRLVSVSWDNSINIYDMENGGALLHTMVGDSRITSMAYNNGGSRIVSGDHIGSIKVWDAENGGTLLHTLVGHNKDVQSLAYKYDGSRLVSGSFDDTVKVWNMEDGGSLLQTLTIAHSYVTSVSFDNDGSRIVAGSYDKMVRVWKYVCPQGTYQRDGTCIKCPAGTFQALSGQLYCKKCFGTYQPNEEQTRCTVSNNKGGNISKVPIVVLLIINFLVTAWHCAKIYGWCLGCFSMKDMRTDFIEQEMTPVLG